MRRAAPPVVPPRAAAWLALLLIGAQACGRAEPGRRPDVVLVSIDSLRHDHLGCYGYGRSTSPTIDRLAAEGVRCAQAVSTTSWTLPAHAALFTGLYDAAHGVVKNKRRLARGHVTLAEALRDEGYQTAGFYGGPFLHPTYGLDQGFEHYESCMAGLPDDLGREQVRERAEEGFTSAEDVTGPRTLEAVARWLAGADERPLFLFVHLWDVHYDYAPPPEYAELFDPGYQGSLDARDLEHNPALHAGMPARDREHLVALYDGEIRFTDDVLARLLALLSERRPAEPLLVVTADHGEELFDHGGKGHGHTLFDEVVRVPLIFRWPGRLPAGAVVTEQVRLIDVMPTLLALTGSARPFGGQGRDLGPLLCGEALASEPALCQLQMGRPKLSGLRTGEYKLIGPLGGGEPTSAFDLIADPKEQHPLAAEGDAWLARRAAHQSLEAAVEERAGPRAAAAEPSAELERRLERLGYAGGD